jgi:hypothetical protein
MIFWKGDNSERIACFYLMPEPSFSDATGLKNELLICYAPFGNIHNRTVELLESVVEQERVRIDPLGSILISDADDTVSVVDEYLETHWETSLIVGLSRTDVVNLHNEKEVYKLFYKRLLNCILVLDSWDGFDSKSQRMFIVLLKLRKLARINEEDATQRSSEALSGLEAIVTVTANENFPEVPISVKGLKLRRGTLEVFLEVMVVGAATIKSLKITKHSEKEFVFFLRI